jgi:hypothetical protein
VLQSNVVARYTHGQNIDEPLADHRREDKLPQIGDVGEKRMFYNGDVATDLSAAEFGILSGKVSYIWLSHNE